MNLKKFWVLSTSILGVILFVWCSQKAPELSFEETVKVYSEQQSSLKEVFSFVEKSDSQMRNTLGVTTKYSAEETSWKLDVKTVVTNDNESKDSKAEISIALDTDTDIENKEGFAVKSAKIDIDTLIKDFNLYFKLVDLSVEANEKEYVGTMMALIDWFKDRWFILNNPELSELLKTSSEQQFNITEYLDKQENQEKFFKNQELTTYDGNPAWKFDFNTDEIKTLIKEVYSLEQQDTAALYWEDEESLAKQAESLEAFNTMVDEIELNNVKAYFVIRSAEKVDLIIENADIQMWETLINIAETINKKWFGDDSLTYIVTISQNTKVEGLNVDDVKIKATINLIPKMLSYGIELIVESLINEESDEILNLKWDITASISSNQAGLKTDFKVNANNISADVEAEFISEKIKDYVFDNPTDVLDIEDLIDGLIGWGSYDENNEISLTENEIETGDQENLNETNEGENEKTENDEE